MVDPDVRRRRYRRPAPARGPLHQSANPGSPITPPGIIRGYGDIFRALRSPSRPRRVAAAAFTVVFLLPMLLVLVGYAITVVRAL